MVAVARFINSRRSTLRCEPSVRTSLLSTCRMILKVLLLVCFAGLIVANDVPVSATDKAVDEFTIQMLAATAGIENRPASWLNSSWTDWSCSTQVVTFGVIRWHVDMTVLGYASGVFNLTRLNATFPIYSLTTRCLGLILDLGALPQSMVWLQATDGVVSPWSLTMGGLLRA